MGEDIESLWMYAFWNDAMPSASLIVATAMMMYLSMENYVGKSLQMGALPTQDLDLEEGDEKAMQIDQMDEEDERRRPSEWLPRRSETVKPPSLPHTQPFTHPLTVDHCGRCRRWGRVGFGGV